MTMLELVNKVLRRLREDEVTSLSDPYTQLIVEFIAEVQEEIQGYHDWARYDITCTARLVAGAYDYDLTRTIGYGGAVESNFTPPGEGSFLRFVDNVPQAWFFEDNSTDTKGTPLTLVDRGVLESHYREDSGATGDPVEFAIQPSSENPGWRLSVYPTPTATRYIKLRFHNPPTLIDPDTAVASGSVIGFHRLMYLGVLYLALNERGEEMGEPGGVAERRYYNALAAEKERELNMSAKTNAAEFYRD